ncbi:MAG: glutamate--tRNA ligase [Candidatus Zixiibacteriota bacterium]
MSSQPVRVRIAPSPSGYLHVGTARMAIANYLYARHTGGRFMIRIEDTDAARSDQALVEPILSALEWLGLTWDEDIVYQSKRLDLYRQKAQEILESGHGYRCFCTPEQLELDREEARNVKGPLQYNRRCLGLTEADIQKKLQAGEQFAIRLKIPDGETVFNDIVSGELKRQNSEIEDFIIARSDGTATYNLAVVVDDHAMGISHVIRGNDHITNTFKQIHIYSALGYSLPVFGHLPMILRPDKKKVSKRLGDKDVGEYRREGILPEAMFNFLCLLGWSPKTDREIYTVKELIDIFNPGNFNASNAIFDEEKLEAFNREHIQMKSDHELATLVAPMLVEAGATTKYWLETRWDYLRAVIRTLKDRARRLTDFVSMGAYFFSFDYAYDEMAAQKNFTPEAGELLAELAGRFEELTEFTHDTTEAALNQLAGEKDVKKASLIHPTRLAVSGVPTGPGLYDVLVLLGKPIVIERMKKAVEYIDRKSQPNT